ncbi:hypothetical protein B0181_07925 [Moraxella caviae]|uniref:Uncharacterized protein n=1 Tax=Moraxella caviae TaxID=34060 RepID=A0A1S9ZYR2_9GAMM|nr:hypothetical protein [Moraxella caviae]OOR88635.1 hypothetical protein B0181_07925 [Moraxella caviae]STZ13681.1 Uncharacterised protein [Moraxella caviae]
MQGIDYDLVPCHISEIKSGDTVLVDGKLKTISQSNIKIKDGMMTLCGDSYHLGNKPVPRVRIKRAVSQSVSPKGFVYC